MTAVVDREDSYYRVRVATFGRFIRVVILIVNASGGADLIVEGAGPARSLGSPRPALEDGSGGDGVRLTRGVSNMIPKLLRLLNPDTRYQLTVVSNKPPVNEDPVSGSSFGLPTGPLRRPEGVVSATRRHLARQPRRSHSERAGPTGQSA